MNKVAIITDTHFGVRSNSTAIMKYFEKFYQNVFFPTLRERKIELIFHLGDVFDKRKGIDFLSLEEARRIFFSDFNAFSSFMFIGNHDIPYLHDNSINAPQLLLSDYYNFDFVWEPEIYNHKGTKVLLLPWINNNNRDQALQMLRDEKPRVVLGHLELANFSMSRTRVNDHGMSADIFKDVELVLSGHYHLKSQKGNIHYLGAPYEMTWEDYDTDKGFHILDLETLELEFIKNPYSLFHRIEYTDDLEITDSVEDAYLKVIVQDKVNQTKFEKFIDGLKAQSPSSLTIIENVPVVGEDEEEQNYEISDTISVINNYVDNIDNLTISKTALKDLFGELYRGAHEMEV